MLAWNGGPRGPRPWRSSVEEAKNGMLSHHSHPSKTRRGYCWRLIPSHLSESPRLRNARCIWRNLSAQTALLRLRARSGFVAELKNASPRALSIDYQPSYARFPALVCGHMRRIARPNHVPSFHILSAHNDVTPGPSRGPAPRDARTRCLAGRVQLRTSRRGNDAVSPASPTDVAPDVLLSPLPRARRAPTPTVGSCGASPCTALCS